MKIDLLDDILRSRSPARSPPLILLHEAKPVHKKTLIEAEEEDDLLETFAGPATRSVARSGDFDSNAPKPIYETPSHDERVSSLRPSASTFTPRQPTQILGLRPTAPSFISRQPRASSTKYQAAITETRGLTSSNTCTSDHSSSLLITEVPSRPPSPTSPCRTPSPLYGESLSHRAHRRRSPSPFSRSTSPVTYTPRSGRPDLSRPYSISPSPTATPPPALKRSYSFDSLPDLDSEVEDSPPTSLSSRASPLDEERGSGIVITSEEDFGKWFAFDFKPIQLDNLEENLLVDLKEVKEKPNNTVELVVQPETSQDIEELTSPHVPRPSNVLLSVQPIDNLLVDTADTEPLRTTEPPSYKRLKSSATSPQARSTGKGSSAAELLIDVLDDVPQGMRKPPSAVVSTLSQREILEILNDCKALGMPTPGPSRPREESSRRRPESPRHSRPESPRRTGPSSKGDSLPTTRIPTLSQSEITRINKHRKDTWRPTEYRNDTRRPTAKDEPLVDLGEIIARNRTPNRGAQALASVLAGRLASSSSSSSSSSDPTSVAERYKTISPYRQLISRLYPQRTIPPELLDLEQKDIFQYSLMKAWKGTEPTQSQQAYILRLLEKLSALINERLGPEGGSLEKGKRRFEVDVFGSVSWGGETGASGDLDLIVLDHEMPQGYDPSLWRIPADPDTTNSSQEPREARLPRVYHKPKLERVLQEIGMRETQKISATTPIVKFKDPSRNMECDINVNDLGGWFNSSLILHYCLISPHVLRPMIYALKLWAKGFDLNDAAGARGPATLSSYSLTLMAIAYLQHRGVLPNLQAGVKAKVPCDPAAAEENTIWVAWGKDQGIKAHIGFDRQPPHGWKPTTSLTAAEALRGFFSYFNKSSGNKASDQFSNPTQIISILQGGIAKRLRPPATWQRDEAAIRKQMREEEASEEDIKAAIKKRREEQDAKKVWIGKADDDLQPEGWEDGLLVVQDPFLWQKNCAQALSKDGCARFYDAIEHTDNLLSENSDVTLDQIIVDPLAAYRPIRTATPRRGGFGARGRGKDRARGGADDSRPSSRSSSRPPSRPSFGMSRGRGSPADRSWRGIGRGGRGGARGGAGRGELITF